MCVGASGEHLGVTDPNPYLGMRVMTMIASISISDPTAALMLAQRRSSLRRRQRRFQQHARLRKLLA